MGQKVNPVGMRVGIIRDWNSRWYASNQDFATFLHEDIKIRKFLVKTLKDALLSHVDIERIKTDKGHTVRQKLGIFRIKVCLTLYRYREHRAGRTAAETVVPAII